MTIGIRIPMQIYGGSEGAAELAKVSGGVKKLGRDYDDTAKAAKRLRAEQQAMKAAEHKTATTGARVAAFGSSLVGGPAAVIGRGAAVGVNVFGGMRGLAAGAGIGIGIAAVAAGIKALVSSLEHGDQVMRDAVMMAMQLKGKIRDAGRAGGQAGIANASSQGLDIQRLLTSGMSMETIQKIQAYGMSPGVLAKVGLKGFDTTIAAQRFGVSMEDAAGVIAKRGLGKGDPFTNAARIASELQGRSIGKDEIERARKRSAYGEQMDRLNSLTGAGNNIGIDTVLNGRAVASAERSVEAARNPELAVIREAMEGARDQWAALQEIAENSNAFMEMMRSIGGVFGGEGSNFRKAADFSEVSRRAFDSASGAGN